MRLSAIGRFVRGLGSGLADDCLGGGSGELGGFEPGRAQSEVADATGEGEEGQEGHAGQQAQDADDGGRHAERLGVAGELLDERFVRGAAEARLGDEQARGGRDDERGDLRHETVADG